MTGTKCLVRCCKVGKVRGLHWPKLCLQTNPMPPLESFKLDLFIWRRAGDWTRARCHSVPSTCSRASTSTSRFRSYQYAEALRSGGEFITRGRPARPAIQIAAHRHERNISTHTQRADDHRIRLLQLQFARLQLSRLRLARR